MRIVRFAILVACLGPAVAGQADAGASTRTSVEEEGTTGSQTASLAQDCVSILHITETMALRTLTTTRTFSSVSTNHTGSKGTAAKNGTTQRGSGRTGEFGSGTRETSLPTTLTTTSTDTVVCPTDSASSSCPCFTVSRSTTTVTTDRTTITVFTNSTRLPPYPANHTIISSAASTGNPVVYVVNSTTTLITITTSSARGTGSFLSDNKTHQGNFSTDAHSSSRTPLWTNSTSTLLFNATSRPLAPINSTLPIWPNTTQRPRITNRPWLNISTLPPLPTTRPLWLNTSFPRSNATTTARWLNSSLPATSPTPTSTALPDLGCDENTGTFTLQVSQPGGTFDNWFLRVSGIGLLFTSVEEQASPFGVGDSGELCAMGVMDDQGVTYVGVVETSETGGGGGAGSVWLMSRGTLEVRKDEFTPLSCDQSSQGLRCRAGEEARDWLGCGMQLDLAGADGGAVPGRGLNCTAVGLEVWGSG